MINRWRLEKADPKAKLSPPKKQIVWYVEDTVPIEYRPYVEEGILEWNKAFEKIGFRDAIAVRWQEDGRDDFDPEDINYCTFRWITTDADLRHVVPAGQPDDRRDDRRRRDLRRELDPVLEAGVRLPDRQHDRPPAGEAQADAAGHRRGHQPDHGGEEGFGLPAGRRCSAHGVLEQEPGRMVARGRPGRLERRSSGSCARHLRRGSSRLLPVQHRAAARASAWPPSPWPTAEPDAADGRQGQGQGRSAKKPKLPEEFLGQVIKEVVMHEVGHSLGLRHNFKASTMLDADSSTTRRSPGPRGWSAA